MRIEKKLWIIAGLVTIAGCTTGTESGSLREQLAANGCAEVDESDGCLLDVIELASSEDASLERFAEIASDVCNVAPLPGDKDGTDFQPNIDEQAKDPSAGDGDSNPGDGDATTKPPSDEDPAGANAGDDGTANGGDPSPDAPGAAGDDGTANSPAPGDQNAGDEAPSAPGSHDGNAGDEVPSTPGSHDGNAGDEVPSTPGSHDGNAGDEVPSTPGSYDGNAGSSPNDDGTAGAALPYPGDEKDPTDAGELPCGDDPGVSKPNDSTVVACYEAVSASLASCISVADIFAELKLCLLGEAYGGGEFPGDKPGNDDGSVNGDDPGAPDKDPTADDATTDPGNDAGASDDGQDSTPVF